MTAMYPTYTASIGLATVLLKFLLKFGVRKIGSWQLQPAITGVANGTSSQSTDAIESDLYSFTNKNLGT